MISSRAPIGYLALPTTDFCTNQGCKSIVFNEDQEPEFHYYNLLFRIRAIREKGEGTTFAEISKTDLSRISVPVPTDKRIQAQIAKVLAAVDHAIEQTEALIAKYRRIKSGLMHDLLTCGIDANGNLRDPATHRFKPSPLGPIPEDWDWVTLGEVVAKSNGVLQTGPFGSQLHAHEYTADGVPVIMPQDIRDDGSVDLENIARIPPGRAKDLKRHLVRANDVVFARRGDLTRCTPIIEDEAGICGTGCLLVRVTQDFLWGPWLSAAYRHDLCQRQIAARAVGSTMVNLNTGLLANLLLAFPGVEEQRAISGIIEAATLAIRSEQTYYAKILRLKTGLMQDLLTGKVSIAPLLSATQEHSP